jgi:hypothetical protein
VLCAFRDTICKLCDAGNLHRETQLCAAVSLTVALSCFTDMAMHIFKFWYQWHTFYMASVSNEQQHMDCTITWFEALNMCNALSSTHRQPQHCFMMLRCSVRDTSMMNMLCFWLQVCMTHQQVAEGVRSQPSLALLLLPPSIWLNHDLERPRFCCLLKPMHRQESLIQIRTNLQKSRFHSSLDRGRRVW